MSISAEHLTDAEIEGRDLLLRFWTNAASAGVLMRRLSASGYVE